MATTIGLMGFGRIGRNLFRILYQSEDIKLAAISDIADHKALEYLLRFDTILGPFPDEVSIQEGNLYTVGRQIPMLSEKEPGDVPWGDLGVETVIEATAQYRTREEFEKHLKQGAKRVILTFFDTLSSEIVLASNATGMEEFKLADEKLKLVTRMIEEGNLPEAQATLGSTVTNVTTVCASTMQALMEKGLL